MSSVMPTGPGRRRLPAMCAVVCAVLIGVLCAGCASNPQTMLDSTMYSWLGQSRDALVRAWGPPVREKPLLTGGSLLLYYNNDPQSDAPWDRTFASALQRCRMEVETDARGRIVRWQYRSSC